MRGRAVVSYHCIRNALFKLDPETAHAFTLKSLKVLYPNWLAKRRMANFPQKPIKAFGLEFPNPVGLAAGMDKNGDYIDPLLGLGFGFLEIGGVTPKPQVGNPKPRLFRLPEHRALINRMDFNNKGVDHLVEGLKRRKLPGIVGVNFAKGTATRLENAADDYLYSLEKIYPYADFATINVSCPNTENLRNLQSKDELSVLLDRIKTKDSELATQHGKCLPLLIKISPDLNEEEVGVIVAHAKQYELDGIVATNTSTQRQWIEGHPHANERGGLSGEPIFERNLWTIKQLRSLLGDTLPIISVGGIMSADNAKAVLDAGATPPANLYRLYLRRP